jgi:hypothetical protein
MWSKRNLPYLNNTTYRFGYNPYERRWGEDLDVNGLIGNEVLLIQWM